jgi:hypothetical protein
MSKHPNKHAINSLSEEDRAQALEERLAKAMDEDVEEPEDPGIPASETPTTMREAETAALHQVVPGTFTPNPDGDPEAVKKSAEFYNGVGETVNITTEELASAPLVATVEPKVERPTNFSIHSTLYVYDIRKSHRLSMQRTLEMYRTRQLNATIKDDEGQEIHGVTVPQTVRIEGQVISGILNMELKPFHKVKKLLGFDDVVVAETKQQLNDSVATDKE